MLKRTTFTNISPLPPSVSRETALDFLHNHLEMIDLNPLVIDRHAIPAPDHAEPDEHGCAWYSITDKISYIPGSDLLSGEVSYTAAFHNLSDGLQTHCHAPMGLDLREKWSVGGRLPHEPPETQELGLGAPATGLYIREDIDFRCNFLMAGFVKKTLSKAHGTVVEAMGRKALLAGPPAPLGPATHGGGAAAASSATPPFGVNQQYGGVQYGGGGGGRDEGGIPGAAAFQRVPPPWAAPPDVQNRAHAPMLFSELDAAGDNKIQAR
ncbi:unnamed protein product [Clonostachys solani]|uniref:DUF7053 domain-containing protein n=1 Tax=Clonostachys solani TaxID=160281 RepID=A0A9P0EI86_9HYPO|nr:unnamed protein product [Clonostachys solani]